MDESIIGRVEIFYGVKPAPLCKALGDCPIEEAEPGQTLLHPGMRSPHHMYVVLEGEVAIHFDGPDEPPSRFARPGDTVGELSTLLDTPPNATVKCQRPAQLLRIDQDVLHRVTNQFPLISRNLVGRVSSWLKMNTAQLVAREHRLIEQEKRLRAVVDSTVNGILIIETDGQVSAYNNGAQRIFGFAADEVVGQSVEFLLPSPPFTNFDDYFRALKPDHLALGEGLVCSAVRKDGVRILTELLASEVRYQDNRFLTLVVNDITRRFEAERAEQRLRDAMSRYVPDAFLALLGKTNIIDVRPGDGVVREMTVLFSDIRDFTAFSETRSPQEVFEFINDYLDAVEPEVTSTGGVVDKYIGDAIMALFPQQADDAVAAALGMIKALSRFNARRARNGEPEVRTGYGVNTGTLMLGAVGNRERMDGTVIGDAVNLAARLEGMTKLYKAPLLISHDAMLAMRKPEARRIRFVDVVAPKGRSMPAFVYEVYDHESAELRALKDETRPLLERAIALHHLGAHQQALNLLGPCLACSGDEDPVAQIYRQRAMDARREAMPADWDAGWRDEMATGLTEIDARHQALFAEAQRLRALFLGSSEHDDLFGATGTFEDMAHDCFLAEELLMRQNGNVGLDEHKARHDAFRRDLSNVRREIVTRVRDPAYLYLRLKVLAYDWFANHIHHWDQPMGRRLA
ncbi:PAS domain S-box protein [Magnetofaba australis]|uniref:Putative adenylate/guanylate cyclase n=1 Tax=Magnetofaba australis IT-1 TaxID=1434232 RepID=A0A1Y2K1S2_9PROT|nr:adenylate/guanylate cyclase domain-containing protein [Magnetofaba australis]OSM01958.1 putative adenylate/guanylate cyclase [Magnetofaba australis IT-1]